MSAFLLYPLAFVGGLMTIVSPCILPVLPFVVARTGRSFWRETLPMLGGLAVAFVAVATVGVAGAAWAAEAAEAGRWIALGVLSIVAVALLSPRVAAAMARPVVRIGQRLTSTGRAPSRVAAARSLVVGLATGLLWAPCAGPILGLVFAMAALTGGGIRAASLFFTFAIGAAVSLALALSGGARLFRVLRRVSVSDAALRRGLAIAALVGVVLIAFGWDSVLFSRGGLVTTAYAESVLVSHVAPNGAAALVAAPTVSLQDEGPIPPLDGATGWLNSTPLTVAALRGKVVVVDFWTFECYNCLNALPHVEDLERKFRAQGVVVLGVHTPELARERVLSNVVDAVKRLGVVYPVVLDNNYAIWNAFRNQYWPAVYIVDRKGRIRYHHFGEGSYATEEQVVQQLLAESTLP